MSIALITGVSGQDGSYLAEQLLADGVEVHGTVRAAGADGGAAPLPAEVIVHELDLSTAGEVSRLIEDVAPDAIYNPAAVSSVFQSWQEPVHTAAVNALPVAEMLDAAWRLHEQGKPVRVVQASSAELFGLAAESPQTERTPIAPVSPYGAAKAYAHHMVGLYRQRGLFASSAILYNHESPRRPESFVTRKITAGVARIALGLQDRLELGNLDARRDWGWAPDYTRALHLAERADEPGDFIIATGVTHSIGDFVEAACDRVGISDWSALVSVNPDFVRPIDPVEQFGDASKARRDLGWSTTQSFEGIVAAMVDNDLALALAGTSTR